MGIYIMDKTALIILLLLIIIVALLHKNDKQEINKYSQKISKDVSNTFHQLKNDMSNNRYYHELINQEAADRYYNEMSEKTSNTFNKIEGGVSNSLDNISDGVTDAYHKIEGGVSNSLDNLSGGVTNAYHKIGGEFSNALDTISNGVTNAYHNIENTLTNRKENFNSRFIANRLFDRENGRNTLPTGVGDHPVALYKGEPPYVQTIANKGNLFLAVTDINGFREGDMIIINPKNSNTEMNFVIGLGNNLLRLRTPLKNTHLPNETVYNKTNEDISNNQVPFQEVGYGQILHKTGDIDFTPEEDTWKYYYPKKTDNFAKRKARIF